MKMSITKKTNWQTKKLSEICDFFTDGNWIESKDQSSDGIRLIQTGNIGQGFFKDRGEKARYISEKTFKRLKCTEIYKGDILISRLPDPVGRACILPEIGEKMITAVDCSILRLNKNTSPKFLNYYTQSNSYLSEVEQKTTGTTRKRISRKNLGLVKIPLPPLPEQHRIVKILDEVFADVAMAEENAEKNLQNAKELFESYLQSVFANQGENWEEKRLEELGKITSSKRIFKKEYVKNGVPFYRIKEIKELAHNKNITLELYISPKRYKEIKDVFGVPLVGDILMTAVGTIGEICVVKNEEEFYFKDGNILWFKNFNSVDPHYLKFVLMSFVEQINKLSKGSAYNALTIEKIEKHRIFLPLSITEQKSIVAKLDALSAETRKLETIYQQKLADLEELKKSVLKRAFSGEL
ncbi:MAG: restriction endonuclease subunit S [Patescibacteria group bacterium]|nr:restriction endonuclease subunit S [Patescibacteria group bacterium]